MALILIDKRRDTVKRVVLTSSVAAVRSGRSPATPVNPPLYSDKDWNEVRDAPAALT